MSSKTVFKIFASFGPAGSLVTLTEKLCQSWFAEAYDLSESKAFSSKEEQHIKRLRHDFVNALFEAKSRFDLRAHSANPLVRLKAHAELFQLIERFKKKILQAERQKLQKELFFFLREENALKYQQTKRRLQTLDEDVDDNLKKMAFHIAKPDPALFIEAASAVKEDLEATIEERVSATKAAEILQVFKALLVQAEAEFAHDPVRLAEEREACKEQLFVEFGEDVDDIFAAFKHYGLSTEVTEEDRRRYAHLLRPLQEKLVV